MAVVMMHSLETRGKQKFRRAQEMYFPGKKKNLKKQKGEKTWHDAETKDMSNSKVPTSLLNAIKPIKSIFISLSRNSYTPVDNASLDQVIVLVIVWYAQHAQCQLMLKVNQHDFLGSYSLDKALSNIK